MDKDLLIRIALVVLVVAVYLIADRDGFHNVAIAPITVVLVAVVMFWPRSTSRGNGTDAK